MGPPDDSTVILSWISPQSLLLILQGRHTCLQCQKVRGRLYSIKIASSILHAVCNRIFGMLLQGYIATVTAYESKSIERGRRGDVRVGFNASIHPHSHTGS